MKKLILLIFTLILLQVTYSQPDSMQNRYKNKIGIEMGYSYELLKDKVFSPLNYSGGGLFASICYLRLSGDSKSIFEADINFMSSNLNTNLFEYLESNQISGYLEIAYLRKINENFHPQAKVYLGTSYIFDIGYMDWKGLTTSYVASHSLALNGAFLYQLNKKQQIQTSIAIPIIHLLIRPPYNGFDKETEELYEKSILQFVFKGEPVSLGKYTSIFWKTSYTIQLSSRWELELSYLMNYKRTFESNKLIQFNNIATTTINFKF